MERPPLSRAQRVRAGAQAAALEHPLRQRLLVAAARADRSLGELACELDTPLSKLHYHAERLVACGLLSVTGSRRRAGRPIRTYRAVAESFLVSIADVGEMLGDQLARELRVALSNEASRRELFLLYYSDEDGAFRVRLIDAEGKWRGSRAFEYWKVLNLDPKKRTELAAEMAALISRYEVAPAVAGAEAFLVHAAFAPKQ